MKKVILAGFVLLFVLIGCSEDPPDYGTILNKNYDDPDTIVIPPNYIPGRCSGSPMVCSPGYWTSGYTNHDGPHWSLQIEGANDDGKIITAHVDVPESVWNDASIGRCFSTADKKVVEMGCESEKE